MNINFDEVHNRYGTYSTQWDFIKDRFGKPGLIPFSISDTDFKVPQEIETALQKHIKHGIFGYSRWNHNEFKDSVKNWYLTRYNTNISGDFIVYSPTVIFSLYFLIDLVTNAGDAIMAQTPYYTNFKTIPVSNNRSFVTTKITNYKKIDFDDFEKTIADNNVKLFIFCSPHNPTGRLWEQEEIENVISICKRHNVFIVSDEIHSDLVYGKKTHFPLIKLCKDYMENIAVITSATKTFNLPGLLFSYAIIPDEEIRSRFLSNLSNKYALSSPCILGLIATMTAYKECAYFVDELLEYLEKNNNFLELELSKIKQLGYIKPQATYLGLIKTGYNIEKLVEKLIEENIAIMNGKIYEADDCLRINFGCPKSKLELAVHALKKIFKPEFTPQGGWGC